MHNSTHAVKRAASSLRGASDGPSSLCRGFCRWLEARAAGAAIPQWGVSFAATCPLCADRLRPIYIYIYIYTYKILMPDDQLDVRDRASASSPTHAPPPRRRPSRLPRGTAWAGSRDSAQSHRADAILDSISRYSFPACVLQLRTHRSPAQTAPAMRGRARIDACPQNCRASYAQGTYVARAMLRRCASIPTEARPIYIYIYI